MNSQWISTVPMVFFALIAGALSDEFGRKPLILFPMIGSMVEI
jgi:MFS family permease